MKFLNKIPNWLWWILFLGVSFLALLIVLLNIFTKIDWLSITQSITGICMVIIATIALTTWKWQIRAQKHIDFIDELTDTVHTFILLTSGPLASLKFAKIAIDSYSTTYKDTEELKNIGAIEFIKNEGKITREDIQKQLGALRPILSKMKSLAAKGQVFGITDYFKCQKACEMLEWSYNQIEAFSAIIGETTLNWKNPKVQGVLQKILSIDPEQIEKNLKEQNLEYILFAKQAYKNI